MKKSFYIFVLTALVFLLFPKVTSAKVCIVTINVPIAGPTPSCEPFVATASGATDNDKCNSTYGAAASVAGGTVTSNSAADCAAWTSGSGSSGAGGTTPPAAGGTSSTTASSTGGGGSATLPVIQLPNPLNNDETKIPVLVGNVLKSALGILGGITLFVFVYGAWNWIASAGYPQRVQKGVQTMLFAVVGLFVIFAAYGILNLFIETLLKGG